MRRLKAKSRLKINSQEEIWPSSKMKFARHRHTEIFLPHLISIGFPSCYRFGHKKVYVSTRPSFVAADDVHKEFGGERFSVK